MFTYLLVNSVNVKGASRGARRLGLPNRTPAVRRAIIEFPMKARVFVTPKSTVLDPQGQTVRSALNGLGFAAIAEVHQGKFFEIALASGTTREQAQTDIETIAHEVLANPVDRKSTRLNSSHLGISYA